MLLPQNSPAPFFTAPYRDMGIDALGPVTHQIVTDVQTLVGAAALPSGSNLYADLLVSLHTSFGQGLAIVGGLMNASAPVNRLPREVLINVFALCPRGKMHCSEVGELAYWPFKTEIDIGDLHSLKNVCRYWRDLATAAPTLWTTIGSDPRQPSFRRSVYLPKNPSPALIVHVDRYWNPGTMSDFMLKNTSNIREFHAWDKTSIPDASFLEQFDASALEHCTLRGEHPRRVRPSLSTPRVESLLFNGGGARLRSLCLTDPPGLPANGFPALTLLLVASFRSHITIGDLFKFVAGTPRLEELYVYDIQRNTSHTSTASLLPISLPRLQYLYYTYRRDRDDGWEQGADPIEYLLSNTSIPSTCHMYFTVNAGFLERLYDGTHMRPHVRYDYTGRDILKSVSRHIHGKDAVSRAFIWLATGSDASTMQFVFPQGSVRLQLGSQFTCVNTLPSLAPFLSQTEDVRVRYTSPQGSTDLVRALPEVLPTTFPNLKVLSLIRQSAKTKTSNNSWAPGSESVDPVHLLHGYLVQAPRPSNPPGPETERAPWHPKLDTLWVSVRSQEEVASLQKRLAGRAALGFPIRRVIVHHCFAGDSEALVQLRALEVNAEEVILTHTRPSRFDSLREVDWVERLPDRFELPAALREGWPTKWYETEGDSRHHLEEDSDSE